MSHHVATLRNKSIGSWFSKIQNHPNSQWVWLGVKSEEDGIIMPIRYKPTPESPLAIHLMTYRIPPYLKSIAETTFGYREEYVSKIINVKLLKVDIIPLGKGRHIKVRPYVVRCTPDSLRVLEKRCWELTGATSLEGKVWRFNTVDSHPAWQHTTSKIKVHCKYPIRDALKFVEEFEAPFTEEAFPFDGLPYLASLQEGIRYAVVDPSTHNVERWCIPRIKFIAELKKRIMA